MPGEGEDSPLVMVILFSPPLLHLFDRLVIGAPPNGYGAIAQLVERLHGMQEVSGSIPLSSTILLQTQSAVFSNTSETLVFVARCPAPQPDTQTAPDSDTGRR